MKRTILFHSLTILLLAGAVSCTRDMIETEAPEPGSIQFSSYRKQVFTRADIDLFNFDAGTKYSLFAVRHSDTEAGYQWATDRFFMNWGQVGVETTTHTIDYSDPGFFPETGTLDFYALTFATASAPSVEGMARVDGETPIYTINQDATNRLPDLMHSNEAKALNATDGTVVLPFEHALSAVTFLVTKEEDGSNELNITDITLNNVALSASMNLVTGKWTSENVGSQNYFSGSLTLTEEAQEPVREDVLVVPNDAYADASDDSTWPSVSVTLSGTLAGVDVNKTLTTKLCDFSDNSKPLVFLRNHKYVLSIMVVKNDVRIVEIIPKMYEWVDVNVTQEYPGALGQPVTFGNVVWMDRNLGATSADCENDFLHSMGYYYQFGRNIPYIFDPAIWARFHNNPRVFYKSGSWEAIRDDHNKLSGWEWVMNGGVQTASYNVTTQTVGTQTTFLRTQESVFSRRREVKRDAQNNEYTMGHFDVHTAGYQSSYDPLFYTYDQNGRRVSIWRSGYRCLDYNPANQTDTTLYPALNPGDPGSYAFSVGKYEDEHISWAWTADGEAPNWEAYRDYWGNEVSNPANQPAPYGWRMADRRDVYTILPEAPVRGWNEEKAYLYQGNTSSDMTKSSNPDPSLQIPASRYVGEYNFQYIVGRISLPSGSGIRPLNISADNYQCVYGIKYQGTEKAYRIKIEQKPSTEVLFVDGGKTYYAQYVVISRYPATKDDVFKTEITSDMSEEKNHIVITQSNLQTFDWSHPAAQIFFPMQGYIDAGYGYEQDYMPQDPYLAEFGVSSIMRVTTYEGANDTGFNHTFYFRNSGVGSSTASRNALGDPIRLIRDFTVN